MKRLRELMQNQRGIVLAGSLMILSALAIAGVAARVMLQNDHRTSANLRMGSQTFYLAASGIEWGKSEILLSPGLTLAPSDRSVNFNNGSFSVSFVSAAKSWTAVGAVYRAIFRNSRPRLSYVARPGEQNL